MNSLTSNSHKLFNTITKMSTINKISSEQGKPMLGYEGYMDMLERKTDAKMIFRCQNRDCKGKYFYKKNFESFLN